MARGQNRESIKLALDTLRENKLRSGLTILGIVIGVSTVITMSSVINGLNRRVSEWITSWGTNVFWVFHMPMIGVQPTSEMLTRKKLTLDDVIALRTLPHVLGADGEYRHVNEQFHVGDVSVKYNGKKVSGAFLAGATAQLEIVSDFTLQAGRFWTDDEDQRHAHVCVMGSDTAADLFGETDPIGKEVNVATGLFTVIGVAEKRKQPFGTGKNPADNGLYFPLGTFHNLYPEIRDMFISVRFDDQKNKSLVEEEIRELMRIRRKVKVQADDNFAIMSPDSLARLWNQLTGGLVLFMIAISSVGLTVGGVGVMNIMLVSVTERTREIGVRKAIGATKRAVMTQFTMGGGHAVRGGWHHWDPCRRISHLDYLFPPYRAARHGLDSVGDHRLPGLMRDRDSLRHLSGVESSQSRSY